MKNTLIKNSEFTNIQFVALMIILGMITAVFFSPLFNKTNTSSSEMSLMAEAFNEGLEDAKARWGLHRTEAYIDINGDGISETKFNEWGYPVGISADGVNLLHEMKDKGIAANDTCAQILRHIVNPSGVSIVPADEQGNCMGGDFCVQATSEHTCEYTYQPTHEKMVYNAKTGKVIY